MKKILFIDDDIQILKMIQKKLEKTDIEGFYTTEGKKGLSIVESDDIDVVFTDLMMPNLNGLSVVAQIHQKKPACVVVVVSGNAQRSTIVKTMNTNMVYKYIVKPWKIDNDAINLMYKCLELASERKHIEILRKLNSSLSSNVEDPSSNHELEEIFVNIKILKHIEGMSNWLLINEHNEVIEASRETCLDYYVNGQEPIDTIDSSIGELRLFGNKNK